MSAYHERPSMRGIQRIFGVSPQTLANWLKRIDKTPQLNRPYQRQSTMMCLNWMRFGRRYSRKQKNAGSGRPSVGVPDKLLLMWSVTVAKPLVWNCGWLFHEHTNIVRPIVISGMPMQIFFQKKRIRALVKIVDRPTIWNVGTILCGIECALRP